MKAIFFDRDGTLNVDPGYINSPQDMKLYPGAGRALKHLKSLGYRILIISNQSGIGRGKIKPAEYRAVNRAFLDLAGGYEIIDDIIYCPHSPGQDCACRKPATALIDLAAEKYGINKKKSHFVGDKMTDIAAGKAAGLKTVLVLNGESVKNVPHYDEYKNLRPDGTIHSISGIVRLIKR